MSFVAVAIGVGAVGLGTQAYGMYEQYQGQKAQAGYNQQVLKGQQDLEAQNQQAMNLDAMRRQRSLVRQGQAARAQSTAVATNQGAGGGSGLAGSYGGISGAVTGAEASTSQSLQIGAAKFGINRDITQAQIGASQAGTQAAFGSGLASFGGALASSAGSIAKIGSFGFAGFGSKSSQAPQFSYGEGDEY